MSLMKENDQNAIVVVRMMRGLAPFDAAKVDAAFAQWADTAQKFPGLFPDNSKTGQNTRAAPKIWMTRADFDAKAAALGKAVAENREQGEKLAGWFARRHSGCGQSLRRLPQGLPTRSTIAHIHGLPGAGIFRPIAEGVRQSR